MNASSRKRPWRVALSILGMMLAFASGARADLGALGDLTRARIEGARTFTADQVRLALEYDPQIQALASPSGPESDFVDLLQRKLIEAYENRGFLHSQVKVRPDPSEKFLIIQIDEGLRYKAGKVSVRGLDPRQTRNILQWWTQKSPPQSAPGNFDTDQRSFELKTRQEAQPAQDPILTPGDYANFCDEGEEARRSMLRCQLFEMGYFWPSARIEQIINPDQSVDLLIDVKDAGPQAKLKEIRIVGGKINSSQAVARFLGARVGETITCDQVRAMYLKLRDSARFKKHDVKLLADPKHPGEASLIVSLMDHPSAPPLGESMASARPLYPTVAKLMDQLGRQLDGPEAIRIDYDEGDGGHRLAIVLQRDHGIVVRASEPPLHGADAQDVAKQLLQRLSNVDAFATKSQFMIAVKDIGALHKTLDPGVYGLRLYLNDNLKENDTAKFQMGCGVFHKRKDESPFELDFHLAPVTILELAYPAPSDGATAQPSRVSTRDGKTIYDISKFHLEVDSSTGRILKLEFGEAPDMTTLQFCDANEVDRQIALIEAAPLPNYLDKTGPISGASLLGAAALADAARSVHDDRVVHEADLFARFARAGVLKPLDRVAFQTWSVKDDFQLIVDPSTLLSSPASMVRTVMGAYTSIYPYGSFPWTLLHEGTLLMSGGSSTADEEMRRLLSYNVGPVDCLVLSRLAWKFDPQTGRACAGIGLSHLTAADFKNDFEAWLGADLAGRQVLDDLLQSVANLGAADAKELSDEAPALLGPSILFINQLVRDNPGKPIAPLLRAHQAQWWDQCLRKPVEAELRKLTAAPADTKVDAKTAN